MEIEFPNLQDNLVYHSNILNYDKTFFNEILSKKLKLNFSKYSLENNDDDYSNSTSNNNAYVINFFSLKSKEQIEKLTTLTNEQPVDLSSEACLMGKEPIPISDEADIALLTLINLTSYSYTKHKETDEKIQTTRETAEASEITTLETIRSLHSDNLLSCLLYIDGISMVNIELITCIDNKSKQNKLEFTELMLDIMNDQVLSLPHKEIASHLLCLCLMMSEDDVKDKAIDAMKWTYEHYTVKIRENCLTSNLSLLLTIDSAVEYFTSTFDNEYKIMRKLLELMLTESNINTIYESLFCLWNISNNKKYLHIFEDPNEKYIEKIVQAIRTNKIDKVARIGLMTIKNLLDNQTCVENLFNIKFMRTIDILLTNKWNDVIIKELLHFIYDYLEKNYKIMNSFDKYVKELESGILKQGSLHSTAFWEENYKEFETNRFDYIRRLVTIVDSQNNENADIEMKCIACFDLGEFARLYPGGASILEHFGAKSSLLKLIQHKNLELKNRALVCLQKIMMRSLKK